jgi:hypothetical protein
LKTSPAYITGKETVMVMILWICLFVLALFMAIMTSKGQPSLFAVLAPLYVVLVSIIYLAVLHPNPLLAAMLSLPP